MLRAPAYYLSNRRKCNKITQACGHPSHCPQFFGLPVQGPEELPRDGSGTPLVATATARPPALGSEVGQKGVQLGNRPPGGLPGALSSPRGQSHGRDSGHPLQPGLSAVILCSGGERVGRRSWVSVTYTRERQEETISFWGNRAGRTGGRSSSPLTRGPASHALPSSQRAASAQAPRRGGWEIPPGGDDGTPPSGRWEELTGG